MDFHKIKLNNYNLYLFFIYVFWIISLISYFLLDDFIKAGSLNNGVKFGSDTKFYFRQVNEILNGEASILDYKSKLGYISFLIPFIYFNIPLVIIVFFQLFLTAISAWCLYKISSKFFCKLSGVICVALFLLYFPLQIRNFYILTEMLFIDITIILTYFIVYFKRTYLPIIIFLIIALISIRPNGILFLFSILTSIFFFLIRCKKYLSFSALLTVFIVLTFPLISLLNSYIADLNLINSLSTKGIIWGWSFEHNQICENTGVPCLEIEFINHNYQNNIFDIFKFIFVNFTEFSKVFLLKIFWLLARARPFYSDLHNYYIVIYNIVLYSGFIIGFIKRPKKNFSVYIVMIYILFSMILVGLTFADWSGRFSLYFLPLIMIFSSYGILVSIKLIFNLVLKNKSS